MSTPAEVMLRTMRGQKPSPQQTPAQELLRKMRAGESVDTTPVDLPPKIQDISIDDIPIAGRPPFFTGAATDTYSDEARAAAAAGVDVNTGLKGAPLGDASLAPNKSYRTAFLGDYVAKRFGAETPIRIGPESKDFEFVNPATNKWTTVDAAGFRPSDLKSMLGPVLVGAPTIAGGAIGTSGGVYGATGGSAAGAFLGEAGRLFLGKSKKVHDLTNAEILTEAAKTAGLEAAFTYSGERAMKLIQLAKRFWKPEALPKKEAEALLRETEDALGLINEVNQVGGRFNPTIPGILQDAEAQGRLTQAASQSHEDRRLAQATLKENQDSLSKYYDATIGTGSIDPETIGRQLKTQYAAETETKERFVQSQLATHVDNAKTAVKELPLYNEDIAGKEARGVVVDAVDNLSKQEDAAYSAYRKSIGYDDLEKTSKHEIVIQGDAANIINSMDAERIKSLFSFEKTHLGQVLPDRLLTAAKGGDVKIVTGERAPMITEWSIIEDPTVKAIVTGDKIDLATIDKSIIRISERLRRANTVAGLDVNSADLLKIKSALQLARREYLQKNAPDSLALLDHADMTARIKSNLTKHSILADTVHSYGKDKAGNTLYQMTDAAVFKKIFTANDSDAIRALYDIANPEQRLALQRGVMSIYRRNFTHEGVPDIVLHKKFIDQYGDVTKSLFSPENQSKIDDLGGISDALAQETKKVDVYLTSLRSGLSSKIEKTAPEDIVKKILDGKFDRSEVRKLGRVMDRANYKTQFVSALGTEIKDRIFRNGEFNLKSLDDLLYKKGGDIREFAGDGYFKDLLKFERMVAMTHKPIATLGHTPEKYWFIASRAIVRPLSREGLVRTAARSINNLQRDQVLYEILSDPKKLKEFVNLQNSRESNRKTVALLSSIGGAGLLMKEESE